MTVLADAVRVSMDRLTAEIVDPETIVYVAVVVVTETRLDGENVIVGSAGVGALVGQVDPEVHDDYQRIAAERLAEGIC